MNRTIHRVCVLAGSVILTMSALAAPGQAATADPEGFSATTVEADSSYEAPKSNSGQLAESDQELLSRTDSASVNVMVKLDYDAAASYDGSVAGLPATSPKVTGQELTGDSAAEQAYQDYTDELDARFRSRLATEVPGAVAGTSLSTVYGGVAVRLPADQAKDLLDIPGVAAVQADILLQPADDGADVDPAGSTSADAETSAEQGVTTDQATAGQEDSTTTAEATPATDVAASQPAPAETAPTAATAAAPATTEAEPDPTGAAETAVDPPQTTQADPIPADAPDPNDAVPAD